MKTVKWNSLKPLKKLLVSPNGATAGRNSSGRITSFHRGGGAKRLQRVVDLKRNTAAMGVVERIEYDPNRSARIALVRWIEGVKPKIPRVGGKNFSALPKTKNPSTIKANVAGQFPLACLASGVWAANPLHKEGNKLSSVRDVFLAAFGSKKAKNVSLSKLPRIAVCGARPLVFVTQGVEQVVEGQNTLSLSDVQKWDKDSAHWEDRLKPKAAVHWSSRFVWKGPVGLAQAAHNRVTKSGGKSSKKRTDMDDRVGLAQAAHNRVTKSGGKSSKKRTDMDDRVALSYIIATEGMEPGSMVMNCAAPESSE